VAERSEPEHHIDPARREQQRAFASGGSRGSELAAEAIELYKAVRAHEVMLNQAASAYEHAVVTRLAAAFHLRSRALSLAEA
jgi:transposase-like protein